jgi:hypothetical protein
MLVDLARAACLDECEMIMTKFVEIGIWTSPVKTR